MSATFGSLLFIDQPATPILDPDRCNGCGKCAEACPPAAIVLGRNDAGRLLPIVDAAICTYCTLCEAACPTGALACPFDIVGTGPWQFQREAQP
jgi:ferredoxin